VGGFSVDTGAVKNLGDQLSKIIADLEAAGASSDLSYDAAGSRDVEQALSEFDEHWINGEQTVIESLTALVTVIHTAATEYDRSDSAVAGATGSTDGTA
jgi:hypothetical protein